MASLSPSYVAGGVEESGLVLRAMLRLGDGESNTLLTEVELLNRQILRPPYLRIPGVHQV